MMLLAVALFLLARLAKRRQAEAPS
jgi:hypothetical protein